MNLSLFWKKKREYNLGVLEKKEEEYVFTLNEEELKEAIKDGCVGIGNFNLLQHEYKSKELFSFFKNRIPAQDNINIKETLKQYGLNSYDEMELLKNTAAESATDNYYVKEQEVN